VIAGIFAGVGVSFTGMILDSTGMKISVTHLDGYFSSYQLNKSQYVKLLGLGLIDFLVTNSKARVSFFDMRIVSYHSRFTPSDTSSFRKQYHSWTNEYFLWEHKLKFC
jgi:hypothetical protein